MSTDPAEFDTDTPCRRIAVIAASRSGAEGAGEPTAAEPRLTPGQQRMLDALEHVFPVRFERGRARDAGDVDGVLVIGIGAAETVAPGRPRLVLATATEIDTSDSGAREEGVAESGSLVRVALADDPLLARPLRGQSIQEGTAAASIPPPPAACPTLARSGGTPVWWQTSEEAATAATSAYPLSELPLGGTLRDHLRARCFMGLLPLVHFIRRLLGDRWSEPPLRASFVIDDPNLHWPSYGFLDYRELAEHATRHGYHVGFATVPLDGWLINRKAASLVAGNGSTLSLLVHGNDHAARELGRLGSDRQATRAIAQALRRIGTLERRCGVSVERVMVPPHEACSQPALEAMFRLGMEAACVSRPHPWRDGPPSVTPLAGWRPAELVAGGIPVLPRYPLTGDRDDLPLRAFLGQPLILYGHHWDFAEGLEVLGRAAADINRIGEVEWGPLGRVARAGHATRVLGDTLAVRMYARRVTVEVPPGVRTLRVSMPEPLGGAGGHRIDHGDGSDGRGSARVAFDGGWGSSEAIAVEGPAPIDLTLMADRPLSAEQVRPRRPRPWLPIRRALVEGRDRVQPMRRSRPRGAGKAAPAAPAA